MLRNPRRRVATDEARERPSRADFAQFRRLFAFVRPYRLQLVVAMVGVLLATALGLVFPRIMGNLVDTVVEQTGDTQALNRTALLLIGVFYIFIGTFMESLAQIILFTAVFLPLVTSLGVDPVMFGVFTVITCEIGFLTPPLGANLTVAARISGISIERISVAVLPFIVAYIIGMLLLIVFPQITLFLPDWVYGVAK